MQNVLVFALGTISGVIATVLLFSFNETFDGNPTPAPGVGNASLVLDATALRHLFNPGLAAAGDAETADVSVHTDGTLTLRFGTPTGDQRVRGTVTLNPDVRNGSLEVVVDEARVEGIAADSVAATVEATLRRRLDDLAAGADYRLLTIATTAGRLTLEIEF